MKAWVSRETIQDGKRKYVRLPAGNKGIEIGRDDRFIVFYMDGTKVRRERIETPGRPGKNRADARAAELVATIEDGTFERARRDDWAKVRAEYEEWAKIKAPATQQAVRDGLDDFERLAKPKLLSNITSQSIEKFAAARLKENSKRRIRGKTADGKPIYETVSPASVNKTLRTVRALLRRAKRWGYIRDVPHIDMLREPGKLVIIVTDEHFTKLYDANESARMPAGIPNVDPPTWWRGLFMFLAVTGWRIGSVLALKWADVDLEKGTVITQWEDNKGKRARRVPLPPIVVDHLRELRTLRVETSDSEGVTLRAFPEHAAGDEFVFPWWHHRRTLDEEFKRIQLAAKVKPDARDNYTFHDFRRRVGTINGRILSPADLQALMDHKNLATTMKYIQMGHQMEEVVAKINIPPTNPRKSGTSRDPS